MRVLLDECVPRPLKRLLPGHEVVTVPEMGWAARRNGELLALAHSQNMDVFITLDQKLPVQQRAGRKTVPIVLLTSPSNRLADLEPLVPLIRNALARTPLAVLTHVPART